MVMTPPSEGLPVFVCGRARLTCELIREQLTRAGIAIEWAAADLAGLLDRLAGCESGCVVVLEATDRDLARVRRIREAMGSARVIAIVAGTPSAVWVEAGVVDAVSLDAPSERLIAAVRRWCGVARDPSGPVSGSLPAGGDPSIAVTDVVARIRELRAQGGKLAEAGRLTQRQREVGRLAAAGLGDQQIARQLNIRPSTVRSHLREVLARLGMQERRELLAVGLLEGSK